MVIIKINGQTSLDAVWDDLIQSKGIELELSALDTHDQNGSAKRAGGGDCSSI